MRFLAKKCENIAKSRQKMIPAYYMDDSAPYVYCSFPLPKDIVFTTLCYKDTFPLRRNKFRVQKQRKKNTTEQQTPFLFFV